MILTNTTFVSASANAEALRVWLTDIYVPRAEATGQFTGIIAARILTSVADDTVSYAVQMQCRSASIARDWDDRLAPTLFAGLAELFGHEGVLHFTTHMHIL